MTLERLTKITSVGISSGITLSSATLTGVTTASGNISAVDGTFSGDLNVAGTLTYEDVTNIDSVGVITARSGLNVTGGSVGIGTDAPAEDVHIQKSRADVLIEGTNDTVSGNVANLSLMAPYYRKVGYSIKDSAGNEDFFIGRPYGQGDANPDLVINMTGTEKVRIRNSGNVGIKTTSPNNTLTVSDTVQPSYAPSSAGNYIEIARTSGADAGLLINKNTGQWLVGIDNSDGANAPLRFEYGAAGSAHPGFGAGTLGMIIKHDGKIGIGTDNPTATLEVATSVDGEATLATFKNTSGGGTNETVDIKLGLENNVASNVILRAGKEGNHSSGSATDNFFAIHTTLNNTSSERLRIDSNGYVEGHTHPIESGSTLRQQDGSGSGAATGWVAVNSTTWDWDVNQSHYISCTFEGYISSGTYYWTWRLYNSTRSEYLIPFLGANRLDNSAGYGSIAYLGAVHSYSRQPYVAFKKSASTQTGDTIQLQLHASNAGGTTLQTNASQTLYARYITFHAGVATGGSTL